MAKFEQTLKNSTLTFNTLPEHISKKVDDMDKMFKTYKEAIEAKDKETSDKMKKDLIVKDNEIDSLIKKHLATLANEKQIKEEPKAEVKEEIKVETEVENKEETKENDSNDDKVTIGFFEC